MDIFAGSLPFKLKEEDLKQLFEQYGEVTSAKIIIDKITRQNKGFGFVEMPNEAEAQKAIEALNGFEVLGRQIVVNISDKDKKDTNRGNKTTERKSNFRSNSNESNKSGDSQSNSNYKSSFNKSKGGGNSFNNKNKSNGFKKDRDWDRNKRNNYEDDQRY